MQITTIVGFVAGILTAIAMLPQIIKTVKEKKAESISLMMLLVLMGGVSLWIVYGFLNKDWPIIITNIISFGLNACMFFLRIKYKDAS